ncbi:class I SAM-dependent methyltransferase [Candidatus Falkowbacteria bacterium CG_4_8_14_3_um_filter_36_11]|nr:MAG: class I SAM-dependent methyltransferase [Candidatus Falkowbacteria bacterium CG_4_8_14_3_um_filter_36_11]
MKEENIRPAKLMERVDVLQVEDRKKLLKKKKGFIKIACPACQSKKHKTLFKKDGFIFVSCESCETVFVNPRPSFFMLAEYYEKAKSWKYWNDKIFPASENSRRNQIFAPRAKKVSALCDAYKAKKEILVDVGAGFGTFCEEIKKLGVFKEVIAVEPSRSLAETCCEKGIKVIVKPIEKANIKKASVITNFELIEHLFWPKDFLLGCARNLSRGGLIIITTPNIKGFDLLTLGKFSENISAPNHLNYFNIDSLGYLLKQCGFKIIESLTPGKLDSELVRKKIINGSFNVSINSFLKYILIDTWDKNGDSFQKFLENNNLSSHMWIVAKKL